MSIEVIYLGTGAALPMRHETNAAYVVRAGDATILVDCGPAILQQLDHCGVSPAAITHVYLTHRHGDHALGYPMLMLYFGIGAPPGTPLPIVVGSELTLQTADWLMRNVYGGTLHDQVSGGPRVMLPQDEPSEVRLTDRVRLRAIPMNHSEHAPVLGARFEIDDGGTRRVLAFTGDTAPCENVALLARDADLLVHDTNFSATLTPEAIGGLHGHTTAMEAARHAAHAGAKHLALVHIDALYAGRTNVLVDEARREFSGSISVPKSGDTIVI